MHPIRKDCTHSSVTIDSGNIDKVFNVETFRVRWVHDASCEDILNAEVLQTVTENVSLSFIQPGQSQSPRSMKIENAIEAFWAAIDKKCAYTCNLLLLLNLEKAY